MISQLPASRHPVWMAQVAVGAPEVTMKRFLQTAAMNFKITKPEIRVYFSEYC